MTLYRWAMRNGAPILFVIALVLFVASFVGQFFTGMTATYQVGFPSEPGHAPSRLIFLADAVVSALSRSITPFAAACIVEILGRRYSSKGDGR